MCRADKRRGFVQQDTYDEAMHILSEIFTFCKTLHARGYLRCGTDNFENSRENRTPEFRFFPNLAQLLQHVMCICVCASLNHRYWNISKRNDSGGKHYLESMVVDPHWFQCGSSSSILGHFGCRSSSGSRVQWPKSFVILTAEKKSF
jgi:hypothetical protein